MMVEKKWVKSVILLFLVLGLWAALSKRYVGLFHAIIFITGIIVGRVIYLAQSNKSKRPKRPLFPLISIIIILTIIIASSFSQVLALLLFLLGGILSFYLHSKKLVGSFKNEGFIK